MALNLLSHAEQVAAHLRSELLKGQWGGGLPGIIRLGRELGVNHNTIDAALGLLEAEGLLESQGKGRARRIVVPRSSARLALRVQILLYEKEDRGRAYINPAIKSSDILLG